MRSSHPGGAVTTPSSPDGWTAFALIGSSWWQPLTAVFLGIMATQLGFLGHDGGHKQIFRTRGTSYAFGLLVGDLGIGLSYGWWLDKHNRHHARPTTSSSTPTSQPARSSSTRRRPAGDAE